VWIGVVKDGGLKPLVIEGDFKITSGESKLDEIAKAIGDPNSLTCAKTA